LWLTAIPGSSSEVVAMSVGEILSIVYELHNGSYKPGRAPCVGSGAPDALSGREAASKMPK
jgi:hypothetical protein